MKDEEVGVQIDAAELCKGMQTDQIRMVRVEVYGLAADCRRKRYKNGSDTWKRSEAAPPSAAGLEMVMDKDSVGCHRHDR